MADTTDPNLDIPTASVIQQRVTGIFLMGMVSYANLYSFKVSVQRVYHLPSAFWALAVAAAVAVEVYYFLIVGVSDMALRGIGYAERFGVEGAAAVVGVFATTSTLFVRFVRMRRFVCGCEDGAAVGDGEKGAGGYGDGRGGGAVCRAGYYLCSLASVAAVPVALAYVVIALMASTEGPTLDLAHLIFRIRSILENTLHLALSIAFYTTITRLKHQWPTWGLTYKTHIGLSFQLFWSVVSIAVALLGFFIPSQELVIDVYLIAMGTTIDLIVFLLVNERVRQGGSLAHGWGEGKGSTAVGTGGATGSVTNIATAVATSQIGSQVGK